ncbi:MAG: DUF3536 domain-containing protein [Actinomycetota bacterium]|nr:DUF3536 domain-containing protein [Actinomycetota bacterium]
MMDKKTPKRFICIHGHFYQPFRKNPWTEEIDMQKDAYPYKDWNERINEECYKANAFAHILGSDNELIDIFNNYKSISFNFGPTLLEWIKKNDFNTYDKIIEADFLSRNTFSGHGTAIAQNYNHLIMPLASKQDKIIQVYWAVYDFEKRFKRKPEGMWLAETAVDYETLEVLADFGIKYTILSPFQAFRYRKSAKSINKDDKSIRDNSASSWIPVENGNINTRRPYLCVLPSGKTISVFFYDKDISTAVSFGDLLKNGEVFAQSIIQIPYSDEENSEIIIIASDGEAYGHHKKFGNMALAYCLKTIQEDRNVKLTVFGEYLKLFPPDFEVEIIENTAWSCSHSLSRWEGGCSCGIPENQTEGNWSQEWRTHLRQAINRIRTEIDKIYHSNIKKYIKKDIADYQTILKDYIEVVYQRDFENIKKFLDKYSNEDMKIKANGLPKDSIIKNDYSDDESLLLSILEMQRQAMLMQSSDAWFFDDISRIEAIQAFTHVLMAIKLCSFSEPLKAKQIEEIFIKILKSAKSNIVEGINGSDIYIKETLQKEYATEKIAADFITDFLSGSETKNNPFLFNSEDIFDFYNHEFILTQIFDFEDKHLSGKSGGIYIISKTTLRKEFCLFFFIKEKSESQLKSENNDILKILIRKKTAGKNNNFKYSPETNFFNEIIKKSFKGNNLNEVFYAFKNKPGFRYFGLKDISDKVKIKFLENNSFLKISELYKGLSTYKLYINNIEDSFKKWLESVFMEKDNFFINNLLKKSKAFIILNSPDIDEKELEELEHLSGENNEDIFSEKSHIKTDSIELGFLKKSAEKLLHAMIEKYKSSIADTEILKIIIRMLKVLEKLKINIDFLKIQDSVFELKNYLDISMKNKKENISEEIQNDVKFLFDFFKIGH